MLYKRLSIQYTLRLTNQKVEAFDIYIYHIKF